jgi:hypothetical protein
MNRREFVEATVAAGAALGLVPVQAHAAGPRASGLRVVFDPRYSDAQAFSRAFRDLGITALAAGPIDVVGLWRTQLRAARPTAIAGLTTHSDLEIVQACAAEIGLKLKCEIFHDSRGRSTVHHRIVQGASAPLIRELAESGAGWPAAVARALAFAEAPDFSLAQIPELRAPKAADHPGTLVSWLLG